MLPGLGRFYCIHVRFLGFSLLVIYVVKVVFQTCNLLWVFMKKIKKPSHILLQVCNLVFSFVFNFSCFVVMCTVLEFESS